MNLRSALCALPIALLASAAGGAEQSSPNIVVILADDLGYGDPGCYNKDSRIPTPEVDRLASEGMRFTDAHSSHAVCTPTRYALLTGRYCWRSETKLKWGVLGSWGATLIEPGRLTVGSLLQQHGYATACIGKWHLGWTWPTVDGAPPKSSVNLLSNVDFSKPIADGPTTRGFDYYFGMDEQNYPPYCFIENDHTVGYPNVGRPKEDQYAPGPGIPGWQSVEIMPELTRRAVKYIEDSAHKKSPFFLYFALTAPHYPVVPTPEFQGRSRAGDYGDFVAQLDESVKQVIEALKRSGIERDTLVIVTSDNGPESADLSPGAYDRIRQYGHYSMGELRGVKRDAWEGGHRIPFIARWPGRIKAGSVSDEIIDTADLMGTVAALVHTKLPATAGEDSYNLLPVFFGEKYPSPLREATVHESIFGKFAIRQGDWVYIDAATGEDNNPRSIEPAWFKQMRGYTPDTQAAGLFNLRQDIGERRNLYAEEPEIAARLKALLEKYKREGHSRP